MEKQNDRRRQRDNSRENTGRKSPNSGSYENKDGRKGYGDDNENRKYSGDKDKKASGEGREKRSYGENKERRGYRDDRGKRSYGENRERRSYGEDREKRGSGENRERRGYGDDRQKRSYGENRERRGYGDDRQKRSYGENRERRGYGDDRGKRNYGENRERRGYGDDRGKRSYGENRERRGYGDDREKRGYGENKERRGYGDDRGKRNYGENKERRNYGDNSGRKRYGESKDRRTYSGDKERRSSGTGNRNKFSGGDPYDRQGTMRLNKYIAHSGVCSRREADDLITAGVITVNDQPVTELGSRVKRGDVVKYNGERLRAEKKVYILLNKPRNTVTTSDDPEGRRTVLDIISNAGDERIYPVGRLDRNTTGILLLTNDGELAARLSHPKYEHKKIYHVFLNQSLKQEDLLKIRDGVELEDGFIKPDMIDYVSDESKKEVGIEIHSGKNRIVRRIFEKMGYEVEKLDRVVFAGLTKKNLPRGKWRHLSEKEVNMLKMNAFE